MNKKRVSKNKQKAEARKNVLKARLEITTSDKGKIIAAKGVDMYGVYWKE